MRFSSNRRHKRVGSMVAREACTRLRVSRVLISSMFCATTYQVTFQNRILQRRETTRSSNFFDFFTLIALLGFGGGFFECNAVGKRRTGVREQCWLSVRLKRSELAAGRYKKRRGGGCFNLHTIINTLREVT